MIQNAKVVNDGKIIEEDVLVSGQRIEKISQNISLQNGDKVIDATGKYLLPGAIDDQVHFREPGLTHKATIFTESRAAVAGGVTSFMEMPNTIPNASTQELLEDKYRIAGEDSLANYSFYMGASNTNIEEVLKTDRSKVCGIKIFMGSSTGNMLVDNEATLEGIFSQSEMLIATHCEDEATIRENTSIYKEKYGEEVPFWCHPLIRSEEACYLSSSLAVSLAKKHGSRLHILHLSTARELDFFDNSIRLEAKKITAEACVHHLWFSDNDYEKKGSLIKWNPAIKTLNDRDQLLKGLLDDKIDVVATDHAPHTLKEKQNSYFKAPSGGPLVQHSIVAMMELFHQGKISMPKIVEKMCHNPAILFHIEDRGFIREGYYADLTLVNPDDLWRVSKDNILAKCGWSPFEGQKFSSRVTDTWVNGNHVFKDGVIVEAGNGKRLAFRNR